jgi:energy-coupling factor transporter ATP-binding protein EcfA2
VDNVLLMLELAGRSVIPVGRLSGGERKRASIATELLTRPGLFFLDQPTSGLDPARGAELMRTLRHLCDGGTTVVLTTHNPLYAEMCDKIVVMAYGGHMAFFGTAAAARGYFGADSTVEIYERLAGVGDPDRNWSRRFFDAQLSWTAPAVSPASLAGAAGEAASASHALTGMATLDRGDYLDLGAADGKPVDFASSISIQRTDTEPGPELAAPDAGAGWARLVRQWALLTRRNADVLSRGQHTVALLAGTPLAVLLMFLVLFRPGAFDPAHPSPAATLMIIFWVAFGGFFIGLTYGLLAICAEWAVLRRERFAGLGAVPYVVAKVSVLLPLLAVVDLAFLLVLRLLGRLPWAGDYAAVYVTLLLCSASALGLGLLISAAVAKPSQATITMAIACIPQLLFVGAILPVPVMAAAGRWISFAMTNRWALEAMGHSLGIPRLWSNGGSSLGRPLLTSYGATFSRPVAVDWLVLGAFTVAFLAATVVVVLRKTRCQTGVPRPPGAIARR